MTENKKKILILMGEAGLGHKSAAEAIEKSLNQIYGDRCEVIVENPLNHPDIPDFIRDTQSDYDEIVKAIPELYRMGYDVSDATLPVTLMEGGFTLVLLNVLREILEDMAPDLIITTYPIYPAPLTVAFQMDELEIPLISVVTDLVTVHHVWFNNGVTRLTVPTEEVRQRAIDAGISPEKIIKTGIPVDPQILALKEVDKEEVRSELGWEKETRTLLVAGSPRVTALMDILQTLDESEYNFQWALVAGGSDSLFTQFQETDWNHPAAVYNFIDFMPKVMRASDMIISKAGGLITTESLASGLPLMFVHVLPGQERGNVGYVVERGAGALCETPEEALKTLSDWLDEDNAKLHDFARNAEGLGQPQAANLIAKEAWRLIH